MIYADNAATTKLDLDAFEEMKPYLLETYANPSQVYSFSRKAKKALAEARKTIAQCINADPDEIYFTSGGTESDNWAIKEFGCPSDIKHIITSQIEHHAILNACDYMEQRGVDVTYIPVTEEGIVSLDKLEERLAKREEYATSCDSTIVSIMFANNEIGTLQPIKDIAKLSHQYGAIFHTDAVQAVGHVKIDVKDMEIDMLSASAHKFNGPKGIGFLYIRKGILISSHNDGGAQERGKRAGTENVAAIIGMSRALENNYRELELNEAKLFEYEKIIERGLESQNINFVRNGAKKHIPGNMSLSFAGFEGEAILHRLDLMKICVSTGAACDSVDTQVSHVLKAIHLDETLAKGTIRISFGKNNSTEEAYEIVSALIKILK